jgi:hypothetical protein
MSGVKGRSGGHNRKSVEEHKRLRNYRPSRHDHLAARADALAPSGLVAKPSGLSAAAALVWDELAPICVGLGTLTASDARAFGTLCELQATFTTLAVEQGRSASSLRAVRLAAAAGKPWLEMFGLAGPASRTRLPAKPASPDESDEFFDNHPLSRLQPRRPSKWAGALLR